MNLELNEDVWRLDVIRLEYKSYGPDEGKYVGSIRFSNGENDSFSFKIRSDMAQSYMALISEEVVRSAESLSLRLRESLGVNNSKQLK